MEFGQSLDSGRPVMNELKVTQGRFGQSLDTSRPLMNELKVTAAPDREVHEYSPLPPEYARVSRGATSLTYKITHSQ